MKKRLLALALCLVLMTSLLPITAAANDDNYIRITGSGFEKNAGSGYVLKDNRLEFYFCGRNDTSFWGRCLGLYQDSEGNSPMTDALVDGSTYYLKYFIGNANNIPEDEFKQFAKSLNASNCSLAIPGYTVSFVKGNGDFGDVIEMNFVFQVTKNHNWGFIVSENNDTLTAQCQNEGCNTPPLSVTLKADSVTLPNSPFNAQVILNGITEEEIKEEFGYLISPIRYKFKAPGDSAFTEITPADGAREGTYQAAVTLSPMEVAARYARNDDGTTQGLVTEPDGSITLYTQYTAVNPETTAQTGDDRPIELMMGSVVAFSALAAAAFILDSKRRSQQ